MFVGAKCELWRRDRHCYSFPQQPILYCCRFIEVCFLCLSLLGQPHFGSSLILFFLDLFQSEACEVGKAPETPRWNTTLKPKKNDSAITHCKRHQIRVKQYTCIFINTKLTFRTGLHTLTHWLVTSHSNCTT